MSKNKCNYDCFNCIYDDCIVNEMSKKERDFINKQDELYEYGRTILHTGSCVRARPQKASIKFKI